MNPIHSKILKKANDEAIYNVYLYLADKTNPANHESLKSIVLGLENELRNKKNNTWKDRDIYRLNILRNAVDNDTILANSRIGNRTSSKIGSTACSFTKPNGEISIVFRGTGGGEWIDNGEGLSGIPEENTYISYGKNGRILSTKTLQNDYATDQQVQALNWFNKIVAQNGWDERTRITLSGHSKGGNKAQFITIHSDLVNYCYSFDGHGFSPEALSSLKKQYGVKFGNRRRKISSFSADNDYVNVLGERLVPENQIYYFESFMGFHYMEAMLDRNGKFNLQSEQGKLSRYVETVSEEIMNMDPLIRRYSTLGIMNLFQKYLGEGTPVNGDTVSFEKTLAGIGISIGPLLHQLREMKDD